MSKITDRAYLKGHQYRTSANLTARMNLHRLFSTNPYPWFRWVFDQLALEPGMRILEAGCGPGALWAENRDRLPADWQAVLGDLSAGMVSESRKNLVSIPGFSFLCLDAQSIPFKSGTFDAVIANHMLYHVPDLQRAVSEIARLLKPGGRIIAATNGLDHMWELHALIRKFVPDYPERDPEILRFTLENAPGVLGGEFPHVEMRAYESDLMVTEIEPLIAYIQSIGDVFMAVGEKTLTDLRNHLKAEFTAVQESNFLFPITKSQGLAIGVK